MNLRRLENANWIGERGPVAGSVRHVVGQLPVPGARKEPPAKCRRSPETMTAFLLF